MVICRKCGTTENLIKNKFKKEGLESLCKECCSINRKSSHNKEIYNKWYLDNKERLISNVKINREIKRETPKRTLLTKEQRDLNRKESSKKNKEKRKLNTLYKLSDSVSNLIRCSINRNGYTKKSKSEEILGCSYNYFKEYIESKFQNNMSWENYGEWQIDHIIPISWAENEEQVYKLNNYKNLQPLWKEDNLSKGNIINRKIIDNIHIESIDEIKYILL